MGSNYEKNITCSHCGHSFLAPASSLQEEGLSCPRCRQMIVLPPAHPAGEEARPHVRKDAYSLADHGQPCPACGTMLASDAVLCVKCGYDFSTGRVRKIRRKGRFKWLVRTLVLLFAAAAALGLWYGMRAFEENEAAQTTLEKVEDIVDGNVATFTALVNAYLEERDGSGLSINKMHTWLDQRYPMFTVDEQVEFRTQGGRLYRGAYAGTDGEQALLRGTDGELQRHDLKSLDRTTRLRCERDYREKFAQVAFEALRKRAEEEKKKAK